MFLDSDLRTNSDTTAMAHTAQCILPSGPALHRESQTHHHENHPKLTSEKHPNLLGLLSSTRINNLAIIAKQKLLKVVRNHWNPTANQSTHLKHPRKTSSEVMKAEGNSKSPAGTTKEPCVSHSFCCSFTPIYLDPEQQQSNYSD